MDRKFLETLELPKVLHRLAAHADFAAAKPLALELAPATDLETARRRIATTAEARQLLAKHPDISARGARDVRHAVRGAARGVVLDPPDLLDVQSTLIAGRRLRRAMEKVGGDFPLLAEIALKMRDAYGLIRAISLTVDEHGEVLDSASADLERIRKETRIVHERLNEKLTRMIGDPSVAHMLQEPIITQREGRFVVPLRAEFKGQLKAVIHDQSTSGATLFVEPLEAVDLNNQMRELELAERDEVRRVLAELSSFVGRQAEDIIGTVEGLARLDLVFAKARYAAELYAHAPELVAFEPREGSSHPGSQVCLLGARHPLLDPERVVPIDLCLEGDTFGLVITGPNTGGKTVALKTVGLLALMAQCGLHIPAETGSRLSVFEGVFADIGDEQSIEQSLSTYSAHIANIIRILSGVNSRSLVLLDELGAGTDPQEGSALARAILNWLIEKRVTTLVASHYPELKAYAHLTPGVRNASVEFDLKTLSPTYRLVIGLPGRSNALSIAEQLGLDRGVIRNARDLIGPQEARAESLLDEIQRQRDAARGKRQEMEAARAEAVGLQRELAERLESIDDERRGILLAARERVEVEIQALREELDALSRRLRKAGEPLAEAREVEKELERVEAQVGETLSVAPAEDLAPLGPLKLGDTVRLRNLKLEGEITQVGDQEVEVQVGRLRVRAGLDDLARPLAEGAAGSGEAKIESRIGMGRSRAAGDRVIEVPPLELDLRGMRVEEALQIVERRLDAAFLAGMPFIRVIHGKGTGRLRQAVREALSRSPYVASARPGEPGEGGDGVTVVHLALE
jgi:DNA mismatch repair protein MutS2